MKDSEYLVASKDFEDFLKNTTQGIVTVKVRLLVTP